ncbi:MAG: dienelactone hydrolase family protein [Gammaproteobacteria bacterium]|jgi:carboxymethylenebutenolidase
MQSFTRTISVAGQDMELYGSRPEGDGPFAALVVIQHAPGVDDFTRAMVDRLSEAGYLAVAPALYHRQTEPGGPLERMGRLKDTEVIADVNATVDHLSQDPEVDGERLGIIGFCMGGRVTYLMAAANPRFKAAVAYYGGNTMVAWGDDVPTPFERTGDIHCPLLFHFGAEDTNPSPQDMTKLDAELSRHGKVHEFHVYEGAGHAFMNFSAPERYREGAAETSWPRTLEFLARHLGS